MMAFIHANSYRKEQPFLWPWSYKQSYGPTLCSNINAGGQLFCTNVLKYENFNIFLTYNNPFHLMECIVNVGEQYIQNTRRI